METQHVESLWVMALVSKCRAFSSETLFIFGCAVCFVWLAVVLSYWAYPGGQAWGKYWSKKGSDKAGAVIPGPRGLPVLGSINLMANLAHHKLAAAAERLGAKRLMAFSLGETRVIVTCNPNVAKEILNSSAFADRPVKECAYSLMFNRAIGFAPYGVYWRTLRRIAAAHLFSPKQVTSSETPRSEIVVQMLSLVGGCDVGGDIRVRDTLKRASLHHMMSLVFGRKYELGSSNSETDQLSALVEEGYDLLGKLNWSDHLPWLATLDPQKIRFRCSKLVPRVNRFVNRIIAEHRAQPAPTTPDFVDVLLSLQQTEKLLDSDIIAVLWVIINNSQNILIFLVYIYIYIKYVK